MRILVALRGNALLRRGEPLTAENQRMNIRQATNAQQRVIAADGEDYRRVLPSPKPLAFPDTHIIQLLIDHGQIQ